MPVLPPEPPPAIAVAANALALPPTRYERAIQAIKREIAAEGQLGLQKGSESRLLAHAEAPKRGTIIMYHGFTAGTWQFMPLGQKLHALGYNVFIPRLPGHGKKDAAGAEDPSELLKGSAWQDYLSFGDKTFALGNALGGPVAVMGLSVGGNVAVAVAERHPDEVNRVVAFAPFLWPKDWRVQTAFEVSHAVDQVSSYRFGGLLDNVTQSWGEACRLDTASGKRPGHSYFTGAHAYAATELGRRVIADAVTLKAPLQVFATAVDDAAEEGAIAKLYVRDPGPKGWYYYPAAEGIPHPMVHVMEDNGRGHTPALYALTTRFIESGEPIARGEAPR